MNAKKCKRLRREARIRHILGHAHVSYILAKQGSIMVNPVTTRGAYRHLKRMALLKLASAL
jgi:hypothetical protein